MYTVKEFGRLGQETFFGSGAVALSCQGVVVAVYYKASGGHIFPSALFDEGIGPATEVCASYCKDWIDRRIAQGLCTGEDACQSVSMAFLRRVYDELFSKEGREGELTFVNETVVLMRNGRAIAAYVPEKGYFYTLGVYESREIAQAVSEWLTPRIDKNGGGAFIPVQGENQAVLDRLAAGGSLMPSGLFPAQAPAEKRPRRVNL